MSDVKTPDNQRLFQVKHDNGDILAGFDDAQSAQEDAADRNKRAVEFGLKCQYHVEPKS